MTRALSALREQQRNHAQWLVLVGYVQPELSGRGTAPRPSSDLLHRQAMNVEEALHQFDQVEPALMVLSELEDGGQDSLPGTAQGSSGVALSVTNTIDVDDNSNEVGPLEVLIVSTLLIIPLS